LIDIMYIIGEPGALRAAVENTSPAGGHSSPSSRPGITAGCVRSPTTGRCFAAS